MVLAGVLAVFWPMDLGGSTGFSVVSGSSMEPTFHTGDLVITKRAASYEPGQVVVYRIPYGAGAGKEIIHRIHRRLPDGRFAMQGDNNSSGDPWFISASDIRGRQFLLVPQGIRVVSLFRSVLALALLIGGLVTWALWPARSREEEQADSADGAGPQPEREMAAVDIPVIDIPGVDGPIDDERTDDQRTDDQRTAEQRIEAVARAVAAAGASRRHGTTARDRRRERRAREFGPRAVPARPTGTSAADHTEQHAAAAEASDAQTSSVA